MGREEGSGSRGWRRFGEEEEARRRRLGGSGGVVTPAGRKRRRGEGGDTVEEGGGTAAQELGRPAAQGGGGFPDGAGREVEVVREWEVVLDHRIRWEGRTFFLTHAVRSGV